MPGNCGYRAWWPPRARCPERRRSPLLGSPLLGAFMIGRCALRRRLTRPSCPRQPLLEQSVLARPLWPRRSPLLLARPLFLLWPLFCASHLASPLLSVATGWPHVPLGEDNAPDGASASVDSVTRFVCHGTHHRDQRVAARAAAAPAVPHPAHRIDHLPEWRLALQRRARGVRLRPHGIRGMGRRCDGAAARALRRARPARRGDRRSVRSPEGDDLVRPAPSDRRWARWP